MDQNVLFELPDLKPLEECIYYLVREDYNCAIGGSKIEQDVYLDHILQHIKQIGFKNLELSRLELEAIINAAKRRNRLDELDAAVEGRQVNGKARYEETCSIGTAE